MNQPEPPLPEGDDVLEHNVRRLVQEAYKPEAVPDGYTDRMTEWMADAAARKRPSQDPGVVARIAAVERWRGAGWGAAAAAVILGVSFAIFWAATRPGAVDTTAAVEPEPEVPTVGFVSRAVGAEWDRPIRPGDRLPLGRLKLEEGVAQIVFDQGVLVNLKAPTELELVSESRAILHVGQLTADVAPEAVGFTIDTPQQRLIDRGTRFGVRVGADKSSEVHVFDGQVDLAEFVPEPQEKVTASLKTGEAVQIAAGGGTKAISSDPAAFVRAEDVTARFTQAQRDSYQRWVTHSHRWSADQSTVLRLDFGPENDRVIRNRAGAAPDARAKGASPRWGAGRWPNKHVMLFDGRADHAVIADHPSLNLKERFSVSMWIRMDAVPYRGWTRIFGKGKGLVRNYGVWINPSRKLLWQVCPEGKFNWKHVNRYTEPLEPGRWYLFTGVVDGDKTRVYLDGKLRGEGPFKGKVSQTPEPVTIGHYYSDVPGHTGHFSGALGELVVVNRVLSHQEILDAFEAGRPEGAGNPGQKAVTANDTP